MGKKVLSQMKKFQRFGMETRDDRSKLIIF